MANHRVERRIGGRPPLSREFSRDAPLKGGCRGLAIPLYRRIVGSRLGLRNEELEWIHPPGPYDPYAYYNDRFLRFLGHGDAYTATWNRLRDLDGNWRDRRIYRQRRMSWRAANLGAFAGGITHRGRARYVVRRKVMSEYFATTDTGSPI